MAPPRKQQTGRRYLAGATTQKEDSDENLGSEDEQWEWIYAPGKPAAAGSSDDENQGDDGTSKSRRGRKTRTATKSQEREIIAARNGHFRCAVGDCVVIKQDSRNEAWAGIIREFSEIDDDMGAEIMCKNNNRLHYAVDGSNIEQGSSQNLTSKINGRREQTSET